mgnify:CR=1 FL=1
MRGWLVPLLCACALAITGGTHALASGPEHAPTMAEFRLQIVGSGRDFEARRGSDRFDFDAPLRLGMGVRADLFPTALFLSTRSFADGIGLYIEASRIKLMTEMSWRAGEDDRVYRVDVPTRHATLRLGGRYDHQVHPQIGVGLLAGYTSLAYAIAYNPLFESTYYQGFETGLRVALGAGHRPHLTLEGRWMPSLGLGESVQVYGDPERAWGAHVGATLTLPLVFGLFVEAQYAFLWINTDLVFEDRAGFLQDVTLRDRFHTLVVHFGYRFRSLAPSQP